MCRSKLANVFFVTFCLLFMCVCVCVWVKKREKYKFRLSRYRRRNIVFTVLLTRKQFHPSLRDQQRFSYEDHTQPVFFGS